MHRAFAAASGVFHLFGELWALRCSRQASGRHSVSTLLLFSALKTAADVCMHSAEDAMLQRGAAQAAKKATEQG